MADNEWLSQDTGGLCKGLNHNQEKTERMQNAQRDQDKAEQAQREAWLQQQANNRKKS